MFLIFIENLVDFLLVYISMVEYDFLKGEGVDYSKWL